MLTEKPGERPDIILIPIDSTDQTVIALEQSHNLARFSNAKIVLLSVDDGKYPPAEIQKRLDELAKETSVKSGQPVSTMIRKGNIYEEINKVADELKPMVIMIGLTSNVGDKIKGRFIGTTALQMVRESKHPIITIRGRSHKDGCKTIVLPLDLSFSSREKVGRALELAKLYHSHINIVAVLTKDNSKEEEKKLIFYCNQSLKYIKEHGDGVKASVKILHGEDVAQMVIEYSKSVDADLIIIMNLNDVSIKEFFKGTVEQRIINDSDIPVLSLRPLEKRETFGYY